MGLVGLTAAGVSGTIHSHNTTHGDTRYGILRLLRLGGYRCLVAWRLRLGGDQHAHTHAHTHAKGYALDIITLVGAGLFFYAAWVGPPAATVFDD